MKGQLMKKQKFLGGIDRFCCTLNELVEPQYFSTHKRLQNENILLQAYLDFIAAMYCKDKTRLAKAAVHLPDHKALPDVAGYQVMCRCVSDTCKVFFTCQHIDLLSCLRHPLRLSPRSPCGCSHYPLKTL